MISLAIAAALFLDAAAANATAARATPNAWTRECYSQGARTGCVNGPAEAHKGPPRPLILFLHGYGGKGEDDALGLEAVAKRSGALYAFAQGTPDTVGRQTWRDIDTSAAPEPLTEDTRFLEWLLTQFEQHWSVDSKRISVVGWSLGAFMANRFACAGTRPVASILNFEGSMMVEVFSRCKPLRPVSVLLIHGDADVVIDYGGGRGARTGLQYAAITNLFELWASLDHCSGAISPLQDRVDLNAEIPGDETRRDRADKCPAGVSVELWTVEHGAHYPAWSPGAPALLGEFLLSHRSR
jgi:polyhydroxybutyrate depolymerase